MARRRASSRSGRHRARPWPGPPPGQIYAQALRPLRNREGGAEVRLISQALPDPAGFGPAKLGSTVLMSNSSTSL